MRQIQSPFIHNEPNRTWVNDKVLTREPALLAASQPTGPVKVDTTHPLGNLCSFAWIGSEPEHDLLNTRAGHEVRREPVAHRTPTPHGLSSYVATAGDMFTVWPSKRFYTPTAKFTCVWFGNIATGTQNYGMLFGSEYHDDGWYNPITGFCFHHLTTNKPLRVAATFSGTQYNMICQSTGDDVIYDEFHQYSTVIDTTVSVADDRCMFYRDGKYRGKNQYGDEPILNSEIDWGAEEPVFFFQPPSQTGVEDALVGHMNYVFCFHAALTEEEIRSIYNDPYQFLVPK